MEKNNNVEGSMMGAYIKVGDIFGATEHVIVNPVNCVGVMGAGLAKQFKERYPDNYEWYKHYCDGGWLKLGEVVKYKINDEEPPYFIFNVATKDHWREDSTYEMIKRCLETIEHVVTEMGFKSVAIPLLGAGLGGLDKDKVTSMIIQHFAFSKINAVIYKKD